MSTPHEKCPDCGAEVRKSYVWERLRCKCGWEPEVVVVRDGDRVWLRRVVQ